jgi:hypothetical protein
MKRLALAAVVSLLIACPVRADDEPPVKVPFELLKSRHMAVQVKVNGEGPFRLVFDTGAPITLLNNKVAKAAGVIPKDFKRPLFAPFGTLGQFKVRSLEVGGVKATDLQAVVMDHPTVDALAKVVGPLDGIVGLSFFGRYRVSIDYQAKEMTFVPTNFEPPDLMKNVMAAMLAGGKKPKARVLAPAGQWGFRVAKEAADEEAGVTVADVLPGGAADAAGLKAGDRLLVLDGRWTDTVHDCYAAAAHARPGTSARVLVRRDGKEVELTVKVRAGL